MQISASFDGKAGTITYQVDGREVTFEEYERAQRAMRNRTTPAEVSTEQAQTLVTRLFDEQWRQSYPSS